MTTYNLALIGFGGVNRALAELIRDEPRRFASLGFELRVVAITDLAFGSLVQGDGIDLAAVLAMPRGASFDGLPGGSSDPRNEEVIKNSPADIIVEATFTSPVDGEPAVSHVKWAIESGKHVVTTNKGPVALRGPELSRLAASNGVRFEYEGAVMSGTPVIRLAHKMLEGLEVTAVQGILNGTSNYVLGRMEAGLGLDEAIAEAQDLGYAEADPTADIGGSDVRLKVAILANELLGATILPGDVDTTGIQDVSSEDVAHALASGLRWKLIGEARRGSDGSLTASVRPIALPADHPLAGISGATNAVSFTTDLLGAVTVSGPGAGRVETAYALISDIIAVDEFTKGAVRA
ncbi:homoserine dehydrogenase [Paenarthrobacter nicotinovorans]|uniref:Homoserine dehydrogenase n=1 Tax=Paenarthrobacter nicotinovorans TaxID=29320 RepID=A0ABV0GWX0_PAENI|nr:MULTISPECIES: homoserine dehydrogenase [Micrococcaceae]BCW58755.1 homoserine dehydrogenase [Arthrobacter sp. StoSoilB20]